MGNQSRPPLQIREKMKKNGINPMANAPPPTYISSFGVVLDKYVPPEGDGKVICFHMNDGTIAQRRFDAGQ